jgi:hypothetical protein
VYVENDDVTSRDKWRYPLGYLLWLVSTVIGLIDVIAMRSLLLRVLTALARRSGGLRAAEGFNHWSVEAIDQFGILILGAFGLVFVIFCERFYMKGVEENKLWKRFGIVTAVEVGILLAGLI